MRVLLVFLKLPVPGKVKTRLAASIGHEEAAKAYGHLVSRVLAKVTPGPFDTIRIQFDPPSGERAVRTWLAPDLDQRPGGPQFTFHPQPNGDLGTRLRSAFDEAFAAGASKVAAIGTDCVEITPHHFEEAWSALDSGSDAVFGPAKDGGYYLVALGAPHPEIFQNIPWSGPDTLEKSQDAAAAADLNTTLLADTLTDIDTVEEWNAFGAR